MKAPIVLVVLLGLLALPAFAGNKIVECDSYPAWHTVPEEVTPSTRW